MKKKIGLLFASLFLVFGLTACGNKQGGGKEDPENPPEAEVTRLTLNRERLSVEVGKSTSIIATVEPASATVTWTSSNDAIATVADGRVTGVAPGEATVTAKAGSLSATCAVTVKEVTKVGYFLAGDINGWKVSDPDYELLPESEGSTTYVIEEVELLSSQGFKITDINGGWHPEGMGNDNHVEENGVYTIKFDSKEEETSWEKTGEYEGPTEIFYYLAGTFNEWKAQDEEYEMAQDEEDEDIYYIENMELYTTDKVKVTTSTGGWLPADDVLVPDNGIFIVMYSVKDNEITFDKTGDVEAVAYEVTSMDVAGQFNDWTPGEDDKLALADGVFSGTLHLEAASPVKVRINCDWTFSLGQKALENVEYADNDDNISLEAGDYLVTVQLSAEAMADFATNKTIVAFSIEAVA